MLARLLYTHIRYTVLLVLFIIVVGGSSLGSMGRQEDPTITNLAATVTTFFPGAEPTRVEALVSRPLEDEVRKITEVDTVTSVSSVGVSMLSVELSDRLSDEEIERIWSEIRAAVDDATQGFPAGVSAPVFDNDRFVSYARIVAIAPELGRTVPPAILNRVAEDFADQARNFPGTRLVEVFGEPEEEVRVAVDEQRLSARGLSMAEVAAALTKADPKLSSGRLKGAGLDLLIEVDGEFETIERIRQVVVRSHSQGRVVRVADIAEVYRAQVTPPRSIALVQGRQGVLLGVAMQDGLQVDRWSQDFAGMMSRYREQMPAGMTLETSYDQSGYTRERLSSVAKNMLAGISLVILVLLFTLGWRAAVVVAITLPLCSLASVSLLYYIGLPIHQMSVTGLIVALGLLVDGAIVMTDEIRKRLSAGVPTLDAIALSVRRLRIPLLASTATTVLAFMPLVILPGPSGDFMGSIAISVIVMLLCSLLLSLVLTPALAAWLLPNGILRQGSRWWDQGLQSGRVGAAFSSALAWALANPLASVALALVLPVTGLLALPTLKAQFFPGTDRDQLYIQVKLPDGRSIDDSLALAHQINADLVAEAHVRRVDWTVGESAPPFYYNLVRTREGIPSWSEALVMTQSAAGTDELIRRLQVELDQRYPQARILVRGIDQGPPVDAPIEIEISGPQLQQLRAIGEQYRLRMESLGSVTHTNTSLVSGAPKLVFELDESRLRLAGLNLADVANSLDAGLQGRIGGEVLEQTQRLPVRARLTETDWNSGRQLGSFRIGRGAVTPSAPEQSMALSLNSFGAFTVQPGSSAITRKDGIRTNTVQAFLVRGVLPDPVFQRLLDSLEADPIALPDGYQVAFAGSSGERSGVVNDLMAPFGLVMALLVATVVLTFNSWRLSAVAFLVCLCSIGLSLLSLAVFNYPFGVQALIGVIGSVGVSINAAIIIMTALQLDEGAMAGNIFSARNVVMDSSRHIVSTTITTFGGFLPLILAGGGFWPPFAMAIAGGVLLSTIVSFFLVPPIFMVVTGIGRSTVSSPMLLATANNDAKMTKIAS